jgi:hypothetical chaperone protein
VTKYFGIDFGTSNSTIGCNDGDKNFLIPLESASATIPSAVFFNFETNECLFGRLAMKEYLSEAEGRLMRSLKSILGSSLIEDTTPIGRKSISFKEIIGCFIKELKTKAEIVNGSNIENIVLGRPVRFVDDDDNKDLYAQRQLEQIAKDQGFKNIIFQYEPVAAAIHYEQIITKEEVALIVDIGGGTSDFSIVRLSPNRKSIDDRKDDILANNGIHIGGTDFDKQFSFLNIMPHLGHKTLIKPKNLPVPNYIFSDLSTWHKINLLYNSKFESLINDIYKNSHEKHLIERLLKVIKQRKGHNLAIEVEKAKISLTAGEYTNIDLSFIEKDLDIELSITQLNESIGLMVEDIFLNIEDVIKNSKINPSDISTIFLTGGSTAIRLINESIISRFPKAKIVKGDVFGSVGLGLSIEAKRKFS